MKNKVSSYDILVLGGGIAACAMAIAAKNTSPSKKIAIVERKPRFDKNDKFYLRIGETLSPHATQILQQLGVWEAFLQLNCKRSYGTSAAWGSSQAHQNEFIYSPFGYGWHLDRVQFDEFMISEAEKRGVEFMFETHVYSFKREHDIWRIKGKTSEKNVEVQCNFVADATGRKAVFASNQGSKKQVLDKLVGIYQFYKIHSEEKKIKQGTFIESDANGWWYSATLPNDHLVVAYMTDSDLATQNAWKNHRCFQELLKQTKHTQKRLSNTEELGEPQLAAAHSQILDEIVGDHWLTLGDATMSFDPLSSLGIYKALSGSIYGAYAALDCLKGEPRGLQKYDQIMRVQYQNYLKKRDDHYSEEIRFKEFPFWNRRIKQLHKTNMNQITNTTNYETIDVL